MAGSCSLASLPQALPLGFPAQLVCCLGLPSHAHYTQVPTPGQQILPEGQKLPRKPEVLQWGLYRAPRSLISTLSPAPQGPR